MNGSPGPIEWGPVRVLPTTRKNTYAVYISPVYVGRVECVYKADPDDPERNDIYYAEAIGGDSFGYHPDLNEAVECLVRVHPDCHKQEPAPTDAPSLTSASTQ